MAFLKFMTICDDDLLPKSRDMLKKYDISAYPSVYFCGKTLFIDTVNTNSEIFYNDLKSGKITVMPSVPADVFEYEFQQAYDNGYFGVIVVLPHNKWTDFKHQAEIAKKRFLRKEIIDDQGFMIKFIDSKTFSGGTLSLVHDLALINKASHLSATDFYNLIKSEKLDKYTYILTRDENIFDSEKGLKWFIIKNNNIRRVDISHYSDSVIFDLFASDFVKNVNNCRYNISVGGNCDFAANVIGRIAKLSCRSSSSIIRYGVPTTHLLGNSALCINFVRNKGMSSLFE